MVIDSHQHFWIFDPGRYSWIDENMQILRKNYLPADLKLTLQENEVDGTVAVQADQSEDETLFLLNLADKNDWIRAVVGWVDLRAKNIEDRLNYFSQYKKLKGFRHVVQDEPDINFMLNPVFQNGIGVLSKYQFTYDILVFPKQLPAANLLVEKYPQQIFILDHIAKPRIRDRLMEPWASEITKLAEKNNVYCKLSGIITEANHYNWTKEEIYFYLDVVFDSFGIDRLMFGSDWPVCLLSGSYSQVLDLMQGYTNSFSEDEKIKLFGHNAQKAYNIDY